MSDLIASSHTLPIDARLISIDETSMLRDYADLPAFVTGVETVYLYDANLHTHLCEFLPSYDLTAIYRNFIYTDEFNAEVKQGEETENYGGAYTEREAFESGMAVSEEDNMYMHVSDVEALVKQFPARYYAHGDTGVSYEETEYENQIDALREHYQGNCLL